jgi:hypothetical protein
MRATRAQNMKSNKKDLSPEQREELLRALKARFEKNMNRHKGLEWAQVQAKLEADAEKLWSLNKMERTGGEPDVIGGHNKTGEYILWGIYLTQVNRSSIAFVGRPRWTAADAHVRPLTGQPRPKDGRVCPTCMTPRTLVT